jgi:alpha-beta hydrolase superfamily lysophospholipase
VHLPPDAHIRGAVVLCPPFAREYLATQFTFRILAERLAALGFAAIRFDYPGTGDSAGALDAPGRVGTWIDSINEMVTFARELGADRVALVGMRMGAVFASLARAGIGPVDAAVLWDPSLSGRSFVRSQHAFHLLGLEGSSEDLAAGELPGFTLGPDNLAALRELRLDAGPTAAKVLVVGREGQSDGRLRRLLDQPDVDWRSTDDQAELVDVSPLDARVPERGIGIVCEWLDRSGWAPSATEAAGQQPVVAGSVGRLEATVWEDALHPPVRERAVTIGANHLFGIESFTEPTELPGDRVIIFLNVATEHRVGPGRIWVELSRRLAARGVRCVRFDRSGLGDSPITVASRSRSVYTSEGLSDVVEAVQSLTGGHPERAVLVGLCSGAYYAMEAAMALKVGGVCVINPILDFTPPDELHSDATALEPRRGWVRRLGQIPTLKRLQSRLPQAFWQVLDATGVQRAPTRGFSRLVDQGTQTLAVWGEENGAGYEQRGRWVLETLSRTGRFRFERISGLDHSLLLRNTREAVFELLCAYLEQTYAPAVSTGVSVPRGAPDAPDRRVLSTSPPSAR